MSSISSSHSCSPIFNPLDSPIFNPLEHTPPRHTPRSAPPTPPEASPARTVCSTPATPEGRSGHRTASGLTPILKRLQFESLKSPFKEEEKKKPLKKTELFPCSTPICSLALKAAPPVACIFHEEMTRDEKKEALTSFLKELFATNRLMTQSNWKKFSQAQEKVGISFKRKADIASKSAGPNIGRELSRLSGAQYLKSLLSQAGEKTRAYTFIKVPEKYLVLQPGVSPLQFQIEPGMGNAALHASLKGDGDIYVQEIVGQGKLPQEKVESLFQFLKRAEYNDTKSANFITKDEDLYIIDTEHKSFSWHLKTNRNAGMKGVLRDHAGVVGVDGDPDSYFWHLCPHTPSSSSCNNRPQKKHKTNKSNAEEEMEIIAIPREDISSTLKSEAGAWRPKTKPNPYP